MTSLITRLKKAVDNLQIPWNDDINDRSAFVDAEDMRKLIDPLIDVASGLERWRDAWASQDTSDAEPARKAMLAALARLEASLNE